MTAQHREALSGLIYSVCTQPGMTVLVGEAGTGKTTLLYSLLELLETRQVFTAICTNPTLTRQEFYDFLMLHFGVDCQSTLKSRQLDALQRVLSKNRADGRPSLLIVDEAQRLPMELLEEIRLLLNIETPREKLLEIIVSGQPEFGDILARPELRQLKERVSSFCKLKPLALEEVREYVHHRLTIAGLAGQTLFNEKCIQLIYCYTRGIPRLINSLCNGALQTGFAMQSREITPAIIQEAALDLELFREVPPLAASAGVAAAAEKATALRLAPVSKMAGQTSKRDVNGAPEHRMPREPYTARQRSLGFFASLMDRLK